MDYSFRILPEDAGDEEERAIARQLGIPDSLHDQLVHASEFRPKGIPEGLHCDAFGTVLDDPTSRPAVALEGDGREMWFHPWLIRLWRDNSPVFAEMRWKPEYGQLQEAIFGLESLTSLSVQPVKRAWQDLAWARDIVQGSGGAPRLEENLGWVELMEQADDIAASEPMTGQRDIFERLVPPGDQSREYETWRYWRRRWRSLKKPKRN